MRIPDSNIRDARMLPGDFYHNFTKRIFQVLLKDGKIRFEDYGKLCDGTVAGFTLANKIFSFHYLDGIITFRSKLIENYVRRIQVICLSKKAWVILQYYRVLISIQISNHI